MKRKKRKGRKDTKLIERTMTKITELKTFKQPTNGSPFRTQESSPVETENIIVSEELAKEK